MIRLSGSVKLLCSLGRGTALAAAASTPSGPAPPPSARSSNRTFASLILASRTSRRRSSSGSSSPRASWPYSASSASSISADRRNNSAIFRFQPGLRLLYPLIAHGLVLGGVGLVFAPIQGEVSHLHQTCLPAHPQYLDKQTRKRLPGGSCENRTRCGSRELSSTQRPEGHVRLTSRRYFPGTVDSRAVAVQQERKQHPGMVSPGSTPSLEPHGNLLYVQ